MHPRILVRKIIGRRGVFMLRNTLTRITYGLGIVPPAKLDGKEEGISAMVCTFNEADWVEPSILSVKDLVDEYVVVDSSVDETPDIVKRLAEEHGLNIKLIRTPLKGLVHARNEALKHMSFRWVLFWDADFIAKPEMIKTIKDVLEGLDAKYRYLIYWYHVQLCGDLFHLCPNETHIEHWVYSHSPYVRYEWVGKFDSLIAPLHVYRAVYIDRVLSFHLNSVRSPKRLAIKVIWWKFRDEFNKVSNYSEFTRLAKSKASELYGTDDLEEVGKKLIKEIVSRLKPYDKGKYGDYPPVLKEYARRKFGIEL